MVHLSKEEWEEKGKGDNGGMQGLMKERSIGGKRMGGRRAKEGRERMRQEEGGWCGSE